MDMISAHLHIRDLIEDDTEIMNRLHTHPCVYRFQHFGPETIEATHQWLVAMMGFNQHSERDSHNCTILLRTTGQRIGWIGFGFSNRDNKPVGDAGIGYALLPDFWNQGFATEALRATLDFIFNTTAAKNAMAYCLVQNGGSARVMQKAGMHFIERFSIQEASPEKTETYRYRLSRAEWKKDVKE